MNRDNNLLVVGMGRIRLLLILMCVSAVLWIAFAKLVVPPLIESAYRGESLPFLNGMIKGQHVNPVDYYLKKWDTITEYGLQGGLVFWLVALLVSSPAFMKRFVGEATPGSLGAIRMWTCAILLLTLSLEDLPSIALMPVGNEQVRGLLEYFYRLPIGFERFVKSETSLWIFQLLTEVILFLGLIGWRTRVVIPLAAFCHFLLLGILIEHSFFWHQNLVPLYLLLVLSFTPCGDGWSVDRLRKVYRGEAVPPVDRVSLVYGWARYLCWATIALPYVANGLGKLEHGGLFWWNPLNMRHNLYLDTLNPREFDWALSLYLQSAPDILFALFGIVALVTETSFGLVLFSPVARRILPVAAMMMHIGIFLFQRILFLDLILLQLVFFDFTRVRQRTGEWLQTHRGRIQTLYDGLCPLCRRTVRLLTRVDLFSRLEFVDFRRTDLNGYNRSRGLNLASENLEEEMYVVSRGRAYRGFNGYRIIALALPVFWPLAPWLFVPGISSLGAVVYSFVARNRLKFLRCHSHCTVQPSGERESAIVDATNGAKWNFRYPVLVSGITAVALLCWFHAIEYYPLTSWHLYSNSNTSGKVEYFKVLARYESGITARARLEDGIGALALDGRYSPFLDKCFGQPSDIHVCERFLSAEASAYNTKARRGEKITQYDIQVWLWDFLSNPTDPNYGNMIKRFIFEIKHDRSVENPQGARDLFYSRDSAEPD
jgi:predicted DCC family thiol-disulfide oxidoreductase YuxK